jgi:hypothetical protein
LRLLGDINTSGDVTGAAEWKCGKRRRDQKKENNEKAKGKEKRANSSS